MNALFSQLRQSVCRVLETEYLNTIQVNFHLLTFSLDNTVQNKRNIQELTRNFNYYGTGCNDSVKTTEVI
jgi:hypothetical protein